MVTRSADSVLVSVHAGPSILVGSARLQADTGNYALINLYEAAGSGSARSGLMVHGSGGGSPDTSCNPEGSRLMVHGSGGGSPDSDCDRGGSGLMVHGSGGGSPGAVCNPGGSGLMVHGSGGGASSDGEANCMTKLAAWGSVEVVFDPAGTSIIVHRNGPTGPEEFMVEFIAGTLSSTQVFNPYPQPSGTQSQPHQVALH